MTLSYKARRRWSLVLLLIWLPLYCGIAVAIMVNLPRFPILIELAVYIFLGVAWAFPFKSVFKGIGQVNPDRDQ